MMGKAENEGEKSSGCKVKTEESRRIGPTKMQQHSGYFFTPGYIQPGILTQEVLKTKTSNGMAHQ